MIKVYAYLQILVVNALDRERGQTMAEYAVVLAVITVAIVGALVLLAGGIRSSISSVTSRL
jgi:Flp pilus assembly pilin Flp